ncbi:hypothetical protein ACE10Z_14155 [Bradyrhizobium sp. Pha-3]|uniref:hypothetical protein n=1 Tax=Bradyrhizobium sp. Pha-3 TaxID=208375 RepID=UPI0035D3F45E
MLRSFEFALAQREEDPSGPQRVDGMGNEHANAHNNQEGDYDVKHDLHGNVWPAISQKISVIKVASCP